MFPNKPEIESGNGSFACESELLSENLPSFIGKPPFEEICKQYLIAKNLKGELPFRATSFGSWWGNDSRLKKQSDFDVIAADRKQKKIVLGECKWKKQIDDTDEIDNLLNKTYLLPEYTDRYYYFFSKIPFSSKAKELANINERLTLVTLDEMF